MEGISSFVYRSLPITHRPSPITHHVSGRIPQNIREFGVMEAAELARAWFERVWQGRDIGAIRELCAIDAVGHLRTCDIVGPIAFEQLWHGYFGAFPDMELDVQDIVAEGNKAVVRWRVRATHSGEGIGVPPTGKRVEFTGMTMLEVKEGKIVEGWDEWDFGGLMAKLAGSQY